MSRPAPRIRKNDDPIRGLPEALPAGEELLWQGAPDFHALARTAFHTRGLMVYFAAILLVRALTVYNGEHSLARAGLAALWLSPLVILAIAMLYTMAWLVSRTTVYSITSKRIVMHIGVVLDLTLNLPFDTLEGADLRLYADGTGNLPVRLVAPNKIAYVHLWPHARAFRLARPEPMLRSIADAAMVGELLASALAKADPQVRMTSTRPAGLTAASEPVSFPLATAS